MEWWLYHSNHIFIFLRLSGINIFILQDVFLVGYRFNRLQITQYLDKMFLILVIAMNKNGMARHV